MMGHVWFKSSQRMSASYSGGKVTSSSICEGQKLLPRSTLECEGIGTAALVLPKEATYLAAF